MQIKKLILLVSLSFLVSCSSDNDVFTPRNLADYISTISNQDTGNVIACAASANGNQSLTYIFYYPEEGATDIRYYEAENVTISDVNDFTKYKRIELTVQDVFGGKLQRFTRSSSDENWSIVTYMLNGKLHISNPIRLKNATKPTLWTDEVTMEYPSTLSPKFTWSDFNITDNKIYFQVISQKEDNAFISGTYTEEKEFLYFDTSNVVLNINVPETPSTLEIDKEYVFTLMAVSEDNWVNAVIEQSFVLQNLQEFLESETVNTTTSVTSFAASENGNDNLSFIYYYPETNSRDFRYYETEGTAVDENNFSNYRRKMLTDDAVFGAKFRRFSRTDNSESWYIVTYEIDNVVYLSVPTKLKNITQPTSWQSTIDIKFTETLKPKFTWDSFGTSNNLYLNLITNNTGVFVSGIYTQNTTFQFYDTSNTVSQINTTAPEDLVLDNQYKCTILGLGADNWVNLIIEDSFVVE